MPQITGPAITIQSNGMEVTLRSLREQGGMTRRKLIDAMAPWFTVTNTITVRNPEGGWGNIPGRQLLAAWLLALGQNPDQPVTYYAASGDVVVIQPDVRVIQPDTGDLADVA